MHRASLTCLLGKTRKQLRKSRNNQKSSSVSKCETSGLGPQGQEGLDPVQQGKGDGGGWLPELGISRMTNQALACVLHVLASCFSQKISELNGKASGR